MRGGARRPSAAQSAPQSLALASQRQRAPFFLRLLRMTSPFPHLVRETSTMPYFLFDLTVEIAPRGKRGRGLQGLRSPIRA